ncbi:hypothetical protein D3C78_1737040 [compost metagenome]
MKATSSAISPGLAMRPTGMSAVAAASPNWATNCSAMSVLTQPGAIAMATTPLPATLRASDLVRLISAALLAP